MAEYSQYSNSQAIRHRQGTGKRDRENRYNKLRASWRPPSILLQYDPSKYLQSSHKEEGNAQKHASEGYYSHCKTFPIHGSGQGVTNFPQTWLVISSTICDIYEQTAHSAEFISPDQDISILLAILGFVDDVNKQVNKFVKMKSQSINF
eukprot:11060990-Ditylum_brightwellii.AAC.1